MPLIHSKRPSAFKKNIETEMHAGKPQKQAVAIAYSLKRGAEHKADGGMVDGCPDCMSLGGMCTAHMDNGGPVLDPDKVKDFQKGFGGGPKAMAEGGEMEGPSEDTDGTEITQALGSELLQALESKDTTQLMHSLEAIVLSCLNRDEE
jgi:hypothetical protein